MKYLSLFSGIEAASVAWEPLGWEPVAFCENDPYPSCVLAHRFPEIRNLGDVTEYGEWDIEKPDLIVGGSPCQAFSIAGLRKGLDDPRGNLSLVYLGVVRKYRPRWVVWENVPGALSVSGGEFFHAFIRALAELGYGCAWRVLDVQYTRVAGYERAIPQRRRRLFVVGSLGDWRRAAAVLFDAKGGDWGPAPRRRKAPTPVIVSADSLGEYGDEEDVLGIEDVIPDAVNALTANGVGTCGVDDNQAQAGHLIPSVANTLTARMHKGINTTLDEGQTPIVVNARQDPVSGEIPGALDTDGGTWAVAVAFRGRGGELHVESQDDVSYALRASSGGSSKVFVVDARDLVVRKLTPRECERLQGFPDDWTLVPGPNGKPLSDTRRYKMLGNSMGVNVMRWIGTRIDWIERQSDVLEVL